MKKLIVILLIASAFLCICSCQSANKINYITNVNDYKYKEINSGIMITSYTGSDTEVGIPSEIDGKKVTEIAAGLFWQVKDEVKAIKIPDTITVIRSNTFSECTALTDVVLPSSLTGIHSEAFSNCTSLKNITLPKSLTDLGAQVFTGCTSLKHINIPAKCLSEYSWEAFYDSGLESVEFEEGVEMIPASAFAGTNLKVITLPSSVREVRWQAFAGCDNLERVTLNEGLETIGGSAFYGALKLKEIVIPASVKEMSEDVLNNCILLEKVTFEGDAPENFVSYINLPNNNDYTIFYHEGAKGFTSPIWNGYECLMLGKESEIKSYSDYKYYENDDGTVTIHRYTGDSTDVVIADSLDGKKVTAIGTYAFAGNETVLNVTIPDTVTVIRSKAFKECYDLISVTLPANLKTIEEWAFSCCFDLTDITLPETLTSIGYSAFDNCQNLKYIKIPGSIKCISDVAFMGSGLEKVDIEEGITVIGESAFEYTNLKEVVLPESVRTISKYAFGWCPLESITLNEGLETIESGAFYLTRISEIVIPGTVKEITELTFDNCRNLKKVKFEGNAPVGFISEDEPDFHVSYTVCYHEGAKGFTSPEWEGHKTEIW